MARELQPGDVVEGPFWSYSPRSRGVGVITDAGREIWTRTPTPYLAVRVIVGDRTNGGYHPANLQRLPELSFNPKGDVNEHH